MSDSIHESQFWSSEDDVSNCIYNETHLFFWWYRKDEGNDYDFLNESARGGGVSSLDQQFWLNVIFGEGHKIFPQLEKSWLKKKKKKSIVKFLVLLFVFFECKFVIRKWVLPFLWIHFFFLIWIVVITFLKLII